MAKRFHRQLRWAVQAVLALAAQELWVAQGLEQVLAKLEAKALVEGGASLGALRV